MYMLAKLNSAGFAAALFRTNALICSTVRSEMGSREGARKTRAKNLANNPDFYRIIGAKGGKAAKPENRPFARDHKLASRAGTIGGTVSRRK